MTVETFQNLVIGSGEAGKILAWNLARMGQKTAVVERSMVGVPVRMSHACPARTSSIAPRPFHSSIRPAAWES